MAQPCDLDFTPLVLVTASKPVVGERRLCPLSRRAQARAGQGQEEEQCDVEVRPNSSRTRGGTRHPQNVVAPHGQGT